MKTAAALPARASSVKRKRQVSISKAQQALQSLQQEERLRIDIREGRERLPSRRMSIKQTLLATPRCSMVQPAPIDDETSEKKPRKPPLVTTSLKPHKDRKASRATRIVTVELVSCYPVRASQIFDEDCKAATTPVHDKTTSLDAINLSRIGQPMDPDLMATMKGHCIVGNIGLESPTQKPPEKLLLTEGLVEAKC